MQPSQIASSPPSPTPTPARNTHLHSPPRFHPPTPCPSIHPPPSPILHWPGPPPPLPPPPPCSELTGDDGEGPYGAGGLQLQSGQEAVGGLAAALGLQGLPQAAPRLVGRALGLHGVSQDLLPQARPPRLHQQLTLRGRAGCQSGAQNIRQLAQFGKGFVGGWGGCLKSK